MDKVAVDYLKKVGVKSDGSVSSSNYRFPSISCKLRDEDDGENENADGNLIFSLSYFISDDFSKQSLEFTFQDWYNWKRKEDEEVGTSVSSSSFDNISRNLGFDFFQYFSITETLLTRIYQSRLKGRKAWKKRNFRLPLKKSAVLKAFGVERVSSERIDGGHSFSSPPDLVKVVENIVELDKLMKLCIAKASQDFSYAPFDVYFDCYKKKLKLERIMNEGNADFEKISIPSTRTNRDKVFKEFAKQVVLLQKNG